MIFTILVEIPLGPRIRCHNTLCSLSTLDLEPAILTRLLRHLQLCLTAVVRQSLRSKTATRLDIIHPSRAIASQQAIAVFSPCSPVPALALPVLINR